MSVRGCLKEVLEIAWNSRITMLQIAGLLLNKYRPSQPTQTSAAFDSRSAGKQ